MFLIEFVDFCNQLAVEPFLTDARLGPADQQNRLTFGIKGKRNSDDLRCRARPQFLHIRESGPLQCVRMGAAKGGSKSFEQQNFGGNFDVFVFR